MELNIYLRSLTVCGLTSGAPDLPTGTQDGHVLQRSKFEMEGQDGDPSRGYFVYAVIGAVSNNLIKSKLLYYTRVERNGVL